MEGGRPFHFRHFSLMHHQSTMKVGTDAVLLAAWVDATDCSNVLDIGTGCGIIPLMLAQRYENIRIDALDIDEQSVIEASENFQRSRWHSRLKVIHADITAFSKANQSQFDLIVSNPPFFTSVFKTKHQRRNLARHTDTLSFEQLAFSARSLLREQGRFSLVLPSDQFDKWNKAALNEGMWLHKMQKIIPVQGKTPNRFNMEYRLEQTANYEKSNLTIRNADGSFTIDYRQQLRDFYLGLMDENCIFTT